MDTLLEEVHPIDLKAGGGSLGPIRRFADSQIQSSIDKALAQVSPGMKGASILHADDQGIALETVFGRTGAGWSAVAVVRKPWKGKFEGEAAIRFQW